MNRAMISRWYSIVALAAFTPAAQAQFAASDFIVRDANDAPVGRVVDFVPNIADGGFDGAQISSSFNGHAVIGYVRSDVLVFGDGGVVLFEGAGCTGQAWINASPVIALPRFIEPSSAVGPERRLYVGNRTDALQSGVTYQSFQGPDQPCANSTDTVSNVIKAALVGTPPSFVAPFRLVAGAVTVAALASSVPVAAVTPAALALLAAVLLLTGIAFLGMRAKR